MRLLEYESKEILSAKGIPIPSGVVVTSYQDVSSLPSPNIIKAQIPIGGRQKAGGVEARTPYLAKFNIPFCVATAPNFGHVDLDDFTDERLDNPEILRLNENNTKSTNKPGHFFAF